MLSISSNAVRSSHIAAAQIAFMIRSTIEAGERVQRGFDPDHQRTAR